MASLKGAGVYVSIKDASFLLTHGLVGASKSVTAHSSVSARSCLTSKPTEGARRTIARGKLLIEGTRQLESIPLPS